MSDQLHIATLRVSGTGDNGKLVGRVRAALNYADDETTAATDATFHIASIDMKDTLKRLSAALDAAAQTPENLSQVWLTVQTVKGSAGPKLVLPLANAYPEVIQSHFGLVPKRKAFKLWPFGSRRG